MSWIGSLAGKAELFLNQVDHVAGQALHQNEIEADNPALLQWNARVLMDLDEEETRLKGLETTRGSPSNSVNPLMRVSVIPAFQHQNSIPFSASVPNNLDRISTSQLHPVSKQSTTYIPPVPVEISTAINTSCATRVGKVASKKDKDEELFEILNSPETVANISPPPKSQVGKVTDSNSSQSSVSLMSMSANGTSQIDGFYNGSSGHSSNDIGWLCAYF